MTSPPPPATSSYRDSSYETTLDRARTTLTTTPQGTCGSLANEILYINQDNLPAAVQSLFRRQLNEQLRGSDAHRRGLLNAHRYLSMRTLGVCDSLHDNKHGPRPEWGSRQGVHCGRYSAGGHDTGTADHQQTGSRRTCHQPSGNARLPRQPTRYRSRRISETRLESSAGDLHAHLKGKGRERLLNNEYRDLQWISDGPKGEAAMRLSDGGDLANVSIAGSVCHGEADLFQSREALNLERKRKHEGGDADEDPTRLAPCSPDISPELQAEVEALKARLLLPWARWVTGPRYPDLAACFEVDREHGGRGYYVIDAVVEVVRFPTCQPKPFDPWLGY